MMEHVKTVILWLLILLSVFLTYQIWIFQPNYRILQSTEYIDRTQIGDEKGLDQVIRPKQIVFYNDGLSFSPIGSSEYIQKYYDEYHGVSVEQITVTTNFIDLEIDENFKGIEFIFPSSIPFEALNEFFQFKNNKSSFIRNIDRIVFFIESTDGKEQVHARFISNNEQVVANAITNISTESFRVDITVDGKNGSYYEVFPYNIVNYGNGFMGTVFLPEDDLTINSGTYLAKTISAEHFKQSLFSDPSFVKNYLQSNGEESFTDGNRMMNVLNNGNVLQYINPFFGDGIDRNDKHILFTGLDFLNGHGGFTNSYYYDSVKPVGGKDEITFRLFVDGIPVYRANFFEINNLYEITLQRGTGNRIEQYKRPLFFVDEEPINLSESTRLPSGNEVIKAINNIEDFNPYLLTDINVGYMMVKRQSFVILEPRWFMYYNNSWEVVNVVNDREDSEAITDGLE
ncbi:hypothetical protein BKP45_04125 [Anaerobacillus alkalidiazotrophicus]|uniref:Regulatory protein YycH domain-containing protein n=1 Tax=Anaerobacillus alkalidiazotrophicus TaxID=472963 RepID=A0A1S2MDX0_9BACI|nr:two-component system activity regulator YycH [Anaerobacillus alkalidiazotrophicus]OIJ21885.1 hypothetical protein BKP45_04125 [Anaerobacillus alkalidiazotrophicus]